MTRENRKILFRIVLVLWIILTLSIYIVGSSNLWIFHNESRITYTTSGMTNEQVSELYYYMDSLIDDEGVNEYKLPTFVPIKDSKLLEFDNNNNTYTIEYEIPDYSIYGIDILKRSQSEGMMSLVALIGAILLVFGGILGIGGLHVYAYDETINKYSDVWKRDDKG